MLTEDWQAGGFGLYIHWPFCQAKCPYCDFNSHVSARIDEDQWRTAYLSEIRRVAAETRGRVLSSVYFGGGTPSLMAPETVGAILDEVGRCWPVANDLEVTLEANPTSTEAAKMRGFRAAGVNRVSIGVQALEDADLKRLGRLHTVEEAIGAIKTTQAVFDRVSFDLIYARQYQTPKDWAAELQRAIRLVGEHLSLYQLTIEDGTAFGDRYSLGRLPGLPEDDAAADMYDITQDLTHAAGLPAYEVSNHASDLTQSRHNLIYWRYGDYAGIGPGAHGRLTIDGRRSAIETQRSPVGWLRSVETLGTGESTRFILERHDEATEYALMSLRLTEGMDVARFARLSGRALDGNSLGHLQDLGMVDLCDNRLRATQDGRRVLNAVLEKLLTVKDVA